MIGTGALTGPVMGFSSDQKLPAFSYIIDLNGIVAKSASLGGMVARIVSLTGIVTKNISLGGTVTPQVKLAGMVTPDIDLMARQGDVS